MIYSKVGGIYSVPPPPSTQPRSCKVHITMLTWEPTLTLNSCVTLWLYINGPPDDVICDIAIYADDTTLYSKCDQASDLWQQLIVGKGVPAPPFLRHAPFVPVCPPFSKSLCPIPYFLFHPLSRYFRQSSPSHANPSCHNPTNQPFLV